MKTYHVIFEVVIDGEDEDDAVEAARNLVFQPNFVPIMVEEITT